MDSKQKLNVILLGCLLLLLLGCERPEEAQRQATSQYSGQYPIQVTSTVGMVADLVRQVGGSHVEVHQLCGAGVDPHLFRPTRDDIAALLNADVVFYAGLLLEGKLATSLEKAGQRRRVVPVTQQLPTKYLLDDEEGGHHDPHVWMDVQAWSASVDVIAETLAEFDPTHRDDYLQRAGEYRQRLQELDDYGRQCLATIPSDRRVLVTSHDAFNYFGRAYDLQVTGVQGLSTESEAGLRKINELVKFLTERKIQAVFVESSVPRKNMNALLEGVRARGHRIRIGGELYSDAMGAPGTYEGTYIGMLDHNITLVTRALGGQAPADGFNGLLKLESESE